MDERTNEQMDGRTDEQCNKMDICKYIIYGRYILYNSTIVTIIAVPQSYCMLHISYSI